jgi:hypothetical protein
MRLNRRVPVSTHGGVRGRLSIYESLLLDFSMIFCRAAYAFCAVNMPAENYTLTVSRPTP